MTGDTSDEAGKALPFRTGDRTLTIDLGRPRPANRSITTVVTYRATPRRGLYFNAPDEGYPKRPLQVWTQGQAEDSADRGAWHPAHGGAGDGARAFALRIGMAAAQRAAVRVTPVGHIKPRARGLPSLLVRAPDGTPLRAKVKLAFIQYIGPNEAASAAATIALFMRRLRGHRPGTLVIEHLADALLFLGRQLLAFDREIGRASCRERV